MTGLVVEDVQVAGRVEGDVGGTLEEGPLRRVHAAHPVDFGEVAGKGAVLRGRIVPGSRQSGCRRNEHHASQILHLLSLLV